MNSEELREACREAGLEVNDTPQGTLICTPLAWVYTHDKKSTGDVLRAYVASLLVAKVRARSLSSEYLRSDWNGWHAMEIVATDEQRIRAAMTVLKEANK